MPTPMRSWGPARMARWLAPLDEGVADVHPGSALFCQSCAADLDEVVYSGSLGGTLRWRHLCADCAAEWVNLGGRVALRWAR